MSIRSLEDLEALPVGSRIYEDVPGRGGYSKYEKNAEGGWDVYESDHPDFEFFRLLGIDSVRFDDFVGARKISRGRLTLEAAASGAPEVAA